MPYTDPLAKCSQNPVNIDIILSTSPVKKQELREVKELLGATGDYEVERGEDSVGACGLTCVVYGRAGLRALTA